MVFPLIGTFTSKVKKVEELSIHHLVTNFDDPHVILHHLNPTNTLVFLIWPLEAWINICYFVILVSPLVEAMVRPTDGGDVIPTSIHRCRVKLGI